MEISSAVQGGDCSCGSVVNVFCCETHISTQNQSKTFCADTAEAGVSMYREMTSVSPGAEVPLAKEEAIIPTQRKRLDYCLQMNSRNKTLIFEDMTDFFHPT